MEVKIRMPGTCQVPAYAKSGRVSNRAVKYAFLRVQHIIGGEGTDSIVVCNPGGAKQNRNLEIVLPRKAIDFVDT